MKSFNPSVLLTHSCVAVAVLTATCAGASTDEAEPTRPISGRSSNLRSAIVGSTLATASDLLPDPPLVTVEGFERLFEIVVSMQERIESLDAKNDALTERMVTLETRNAELEQQWREENELPEFEGGTDAAALSRHERRELQQGVTLRAFNQLKNSVNEVRNRVACVRFGSNKDSFILEGCNVHIRNGLGQTATTNGKGNLVVGYNEIGAAPLPVDRDRAGSHTVVVGSGHAYTGHSGIVVGNDNIVSGPSASVIGGSRNSATGTGAVVVGGHLNTNQGTESAIVSGAGNTVAADAFHGAILAGFQNTLSANCGLVAGGHLNSVEGGFEDAYSVIVGGIDNTVNNAANVVMGGGSNSLVAGNNNVIVGGIVNSAVGMNTHDVKVAGEIYAN